MTKSIGTRLATALIPGVRKMRDEKEALAAEVGRYKTGFAQYMAFVDTLASVVQYRQAHFEAYGRIAPSPGIPVARAWPRPDNGLSYQEKLLGTLPIADGKGAEIGPLNIPLTPKAGSNVLYVDHLTTQGLREKYPSVQGIVDIDRPMVNDSLKDTLIGDAPLDYVVASQVLEHVPNPIRWLSEVAAVLRIGGLVALSLPDRRMTFDFLREESRPSDIVAAHFMDDTIPNVRSVYDHHSLASFINMEWATRQSVKPEDIVAGGGAVKPKRAAPSHMALVNQARAGEYLDVHAWVFTPPSFLLVMAQLAADGFIPFRLYQFYPTNPQSPDRDNASFTFVLEKVVPEVSPAQIRRSFLEPLGPG